MRRHCSQKVFLICYVHIHQWHREPLSLMYPCVIGSQRVNNILLISIASSANFSWRTNRLSCSYAIQLPNSLLRAMTNSAPRTGEIRFSPQDALDSCGADSTKPLTPRATCLRTRTLYFRNKHVSRSRVERVSDVCLYRECPTRKSRVLKTR